MGISRGPSPIITDGLVFCMDAGNSRSFPSGSSIANNIAATKASNLTGSLINNTVYSSDGGGSFQFDGTDDRVDCDTISNILGAGNLENYSIECWVKSNGAPGTYAHVWCNKDSRWSTDGYAIVTHGAVGYMADGMWGSNNRVYPETDTHTTPGFTAWQNLMVTYDGSNVYIYSDGIKNSYTYPTATTGPIDAADELFCIGGMDHALAGSDWNGWITGVKIYNRALTHAEVIHNYEVSKVRFGK